MQTGNQLCSFSWSISVAFDPTVLLSTVSFSSYLCTNLFPRTTDPKTSKIGWGLFLALSPLCACLMDVTIHLTLEVVHWEKEHCWALDAGWKYCGFLRCCLHAEPGGAAVKHSKRVLPMNWSLGSSDSDKVILFRFFCVEKQVSNLFSKTKNIHQHLLLKVLVFVFVL